MNYTSPDDLRQVDHAARWSALLLGTMAAAVLVAMIALAVPSRAEAATSHAAVPSCPRVIVFGSRGSGEGVPGDFGPASWGVASTIRDGLGASNVELRGNPYAGVGLKKNPWQWLNAVGSVTKVARVGAYHDSVVGGKNWLRQQISSTVSTCGDRTWMVLVGYSQGAQVSADIYQELPVSQRRRVAGMILFGDPYFFGESPGGRGGHSWHHDGLLGTRAKYSETDGRDSVRSYCHIKDPVCQGDNGASATSRMALRKLSLSAHTNYDRTGEPQDAGRWM